MVKMAVELRGEAELVATLREEALRLERSSSWIVQRCLRSSLPVLAQMAPDALELGSLRAEPSSEASEASLIYMPPEMYGELERQGERLKLSQVAVVKWAWAQNRDEILALAPLSEDP